MEQAYRILELAAEQAHLGRIPENRQAVGQALTRLFPKVSPERFLDALAIADGREWLAASQTAPVDLAQLRCVVREGNARGSQLTWGLADTPYGRAVMAETEGCLCELTLLSLDECGETHFKRKWPGAAFKRDDGAMQRWMERVFTASDPRSVPMLLRGTEIQLRVWRALLTIPAGAVISYKRLSELAGVANGFRAVGNANGRNPISYAVPCHRVIAHDGTLGGYGGGLPRKRVMLAIERLMAGQASSMSGVTSEDVSSSVSLAGIA